MAQSGIGAIFTDAGSAIRVSSTFTNGPAQKAGMTSGDLIAKLNGRPVRNVATFNATIASMKPGTTVQLTRVSRTGAESPLNCQLMTNRQILDASLVPESGASEEAALQAKQVLKTLYQEIKNAETELADMKKRYNGLHEQYKGLHAKAIAERERADKMKAEEEAKRKRQFEALKKKAEDAAAG